MSNTTDSIPGNARQWWLSNQGKPTGPHPEAYIVSGLRAGAISPQTYACAVGGQQWRRLSEWPEFSSAWSTPPIATPPPPPSPAQESGASAVAARTAATAAWSPEVIVWLGLLFSPIWAGIMAAVNARRLGMSLPLWRPVVIGLGATLLDMLISSLLFDSLIVDLILYLGALGLIWRLDLMPQVEPYQARKAACGTQAHWLVPSLAGSPAAALVLFAFILAPLMPLEPREVCQRFIGATSLAEAKQYTTTKLWPALEAMFAEKEDSDFEVRCDLTEEADAPSNLGGHLVGYRLYGKPKNGAASVLEGFFHLVNYDGTWKIEEWYWTSVDNQETPSPVAMSANYRGMFSVAKESPDTNPASTFSTAPPESRGGSPKDKKTNPFEQHKYPFSKVVAWGYQNGGWMGAICSLALVALVISAIRNLPAWLDGLATLLDGPKETQGGIEVYYTGPVSQIQARNLVQYLASIWTDGGKKSVKVLRKDDVYEVWVPVNPGAEKDHETIENFEVISRLLSTNVFDNAPVEICFCDSHLKPLRTLPWQTTLEQP